MAAIQKMEGMRTASMQNIYNAQEQLIKVKTLMNSQIQEVEGNRAVFVFQASAAAKPKKRMASLADEGTILARLVSNAALSVADAITELLNNARYSKKAAALLVFGESKYRSIAVAKAQIAAYLATVETRKEAEERLLTPVELTKGPSELSEIELVPNILMSALKKINEVSAALFEAKNKLNSSYNEEYEKQRIVGQMSNPEEAWQLFETEVANNLSMARQGTEAAEAATKATRAAISALNAFQLAVQCTSDL